MSGFVLLNSIKVLTQTGECEIELCLGDITKLEKKDEVDVIFVSAFHGDYACTPTSLIGALNRNLQLNVGSLSRDKEEDLRKLYSCWWSKPLPEKLPYKRLLCFETKLTSQTPPQELIGDAFRCLVPILKNEDGTVISPLLNTGNQGYAKEVMLTGMVEAAVRWMKAGLPLRLLKIVLFSRKIEGDPRKNAEACGYKSTLLTFEELKEKYDMQYMLPKQVKVEFDCYLSYSEEDAGIVKEIIEELKSNKEDVRIFHKHQVMDKLSYWQEDMYEVMMKSSRVITVLTPNYLKSTACLEQYNIALCCNRTAHRDMLAPFYAVTIENMPTYMGLVQYIDCRSDHEEAITKACYQIIVSLSVKFTRSMSIMSSSIVKYDIFLSYSHKDSDLAQKMVKILQGLNPALKIFFDVQELKTDFSIVKYDVFLSYSHKDCDLAQKMVRILQGLNPALEIFFNVHKLKTGKSWQRALYHSIDGSECLVALMTNNYIKSAVCQEEFNLAMLKHYAPNNRLKLIPFVSEELCYLPPGFERVPQVTTDLDRFEGDAARFCSSVVDWLKDSSVQEEVFQKDVENPLEISEAWEKLRRTRFEEVFPDASAGFPPEVTGVFKKGKKSASKKDCCDIVISAAREDRKYAEWTLALLSHFAPKLNIHLAKGKTDHERLTMIEGANKVVPLLSPDYIESPEHVEEIHVAIWRARTCGGLIFPVHLHSLPPRPAYFHLLRCPVSLNDSLWSELAVSRNLALPKDVRKAAGVDLGIKPAEELALFTAVYYLLAEIEGERAKNMEPWETPRPALLNIFHLEGDEAEEVNTNGNNDSPAVADSSSPQEVVDGVEGQPTEDVSGHAPGERVKEGQEPTQNDPHGNSQSGETAVVTGEVKGHHGGDDTDGAVLNVGDQQITQSGPQGSNPSGATAGNGGSGDKGHDGGGDGESGGGQDTTGEDSPGNTGRQGEGRKKKNSRTCDIM